MKQKKASDKKFSENKTALHHTPWTHGSVFLDMDASTQILRIGMIGRERGCVVHIVCAK